MSRQPGSEETKWQNVSSKCHNSKWVFLGHGSKNYRVLDVQSFSRDKLSAILSPGLSDIRYFGEICHFPDIHSFDSGHVRVSVRTIKTDNFQTGGRITNSFILNQADDWSKLKIFKSDQSNDFKRFTKNESSSENDSSRVNFNSERILKLRKLKFYCTPTVRIDKKFWGYRHTRQYLVFYMGNFFFMMFRSEIIQNR